MQRGYNYIDVNFIEERDLDYLDYTGDHVFLDPQGIIYRGYDQEYRHLNTLEWYPDNRALFYGSFRFARNYSFRDSKREKFPTGRGPVYRFWSKRRLKLFSLNKQNTKYLVRHFIKNKGDLVTAARLIYAFGYLYNLDQGFQLTADIFQELEKPFDQTNFPPYIKKTENIVQILRGLILDLDNRLQAELKKCIEKCKKERMSGWAVERVVEQRCRNFCMFDFKADPVLGRRSFFDFDKPLIVSLKIYLDNKSKRLRNEGQVGYDGIFAWVERDYSVLGHDIIIFNSKENLETDNVDVLRECTDFTLKADFSPLLNLDNCPKQISKQSTKKIQIPDRVRVQPISLKYRTPIVKIYNLSFSDLDPGQFQEIADDLVKILKTHEANNYPNKEKHVSSVVDDIMAKILKLETPEQLQEKNLAQKIHKIILEYVNSDKN